MPKILNAKVVGFTQPNAVYIGRPSEFGNQFRVDDDGMTRNDVIDKFERWIYSNPAKMSDVKRKLKGKDLICWCAPKRCHGEILMRIANEINLDDFFK